MGFLNVPVIETELSMGSWPVDEDGIGSDVENL